MIQAQIHLFLDAPGRKAYPDWLRFFGKVVRQVKGFINIQMMQVEGASSLGLVLIFENREDLDAFFASTVFVQLMRKMESYSVRPYKKIVLRARNLYNYKKPAEKPPEQAPEKTSGQYVKAKPEQMRSLLRKETRLPPRMSPEEPAKPNNVVGMDSYKKAHSQ